jgi:hypothetical protein
MFSAYEVDVLVLKRGAKILCNTWLRFVTTAGSKDPAVRKFYECSCDSLSSDAI